MAQVLLGETDERVLTVKTALDAYERKHPGAEASLYRQSPGTIRVRILDSRFEKMSRTDRHDNVLNFLENAIQDDTIDEISWLIPLPPREKDQSWANHAYENPYQTLV